MNGNGFMISEEEDLALGPGTRLNHSRAFVWQFSAQFSSVQFSHSVASDSL